MVFSGAGRSGLASDEDVLEDSAAAVEVLEGCEGKVGMFVAVLACFWLFFRLRAVASFGSSVVENAEQVIALKRRSSQPSNVVTDSMRVRVDSVWIRSLASACHSARRNNRVITISLCGSGSSPSKTGIAHYRIDWLGVID